MKILLNFEVVFIGSLIVLGFFSSFVLWTRTHNKLPNRLLAAFLVCCSLWLIDTFFLVSGMYGQNADLYFMPIYYSFAFGPLIYLYVRSITNFDFRLKRIHLLHFIPVLFQAGLYLFLQFKDYSFKHWYWLEVHQKYTYRIEFDGTFISLAVYSLLSLLIILPYQKWLKEQYSETSKLNLNWLKIILALLILLSIQWFIEVVLRDFYDNYFQYSYSSFILGILTLLLAYRSMSLDNLDHIKFIANQDEEKKTSIQIDENILETIRRRMVNHKDYLNPKLNLKSFAASCNLPTRTVSEHINHGEQSTFLDFVNTYRVKEVQYKMNDPKLQHFTLQAMAFDSGFNSKATFNRVFKKITTLTPTEYQSKLAQNTN